MHEIIKFLVDDESLINSEDYGEINILAAATTFMRRYLCHTCNAILMFFASILFHIRSMNLIYLLYPKKAWLQAQIPPTTYCDAVNFVDLLQMLE